MWTKYINVKFYWKHCWFLLYTWNWGNNYSLFYTFLYFRQLMQNICKKQGQLDLLSSPVAQRWEYVPHTQQFSWLRKQMKILDVKNRKQILNYTFWCVKISISYQFCQPIHILCASGSSCSRPRALIQLVCYQMQQSKGEQFWVTTSDHYSWIQFPFIHLYWCDRKVLRIFSNSSKQSYMYSPLSLVF